MHELTIAQEILRVVKESLSPERISKVTKINLRIGELTAVQEECLRFSLDVIAKDTPLSGVKVEIERIQPRLRCKVCAAEYESENPFFTPCPKCGNFRSDLIAGNELLVTSVDLQ